LNIHGFFPTAVPLESTRRIKAWYYLLLDEDLVGSGRAQLNELVFEEKNYA
jgi:hypothetical protein